MDFFNINGIMIKASEATLHVSDLAILRGYGVFDFFLVKRSKPLFLDDYLDRFTRSAAEMGLDLPIGRSQLPEKIGQLIQANGLAEAAIRLVLTGGYSEDGYTPSTPNLLILEHEQPSYSRDKFDAGIALILWRHQRELPHIKTINYLTGIRLIDKVREAGAAEPLFHNGRHVLETVRSNFFIFTKDGQLATPAVDILPGITRKQVLKLARNHYPVEERPVALEEIATAREIFITSTTKGVMPVVRIDDQRIGEGRPGMVAKHLQELFLKRVEEYLGK